MEYTKPPLSIDEKINLLQSRGLIINDIGRAKGYLVHIGYFRLTWCLKYFQNTDTNKFNAWVSFDDILNLYIFDRKLRLLVLDVVEKIEVSLKAIISDYMSLEYWSLWYIDKSRYNICDERSKVIFATLMKIIEQKKEKSSAMFIKAFKEKYTDEYVPSWMFFEECTIGEISTIYTLLHDNDAKSIATYYATYFVDLRRRMQVLGNVRNISAHHARLWNRRYISKPRTKDVILKGKYKMEVSENGSLEVIPHFFNVCLIISYLLDKISPTHDFIEKLTLLFDEHPNVPQSSMWFDEDWKTFFT